jgi:hypothetical protein
MRDAYPSIQDSLSFNRKMQTTEVSPQGSNLAFLTKNNKGADSINKSRRSN